MSAAQEQASTMAIVSSASLTAEFGPMRPLADGGPVTFVDHDGKMTFEADGGVILNTVVLLVNEAKLAPTYVDVHEQGPRSCSRASLLTHQPIRLVKVVSAEAMAGKRVVPVLSGHKFDATVEEAYARLHVPEGSLEGPALCDSQWQ